MINKVKNTLPKSTLCTLYSAIVHSHINYGLLIWGSGHSISRIYKLQKRSLRIINIKPYNYHTEPLFKCGNILKIEDQYTYNVLTFMYLLKNHGLPESFNNLDYFNSRVDRRTTRHDGSAKLTRFRTVYTSLLPFHKFPRIWNSIDITIQILRSKTTFRRKVHEVLLKSYKNVINCVNRRCRQCFFPL